ncbi:olfactory receptor 5F1-like [Alligator sinensis]|uniref:Olfactory receptor n=1 Tax=Alligator sinensis TaxID=38654 RepID=A0A1U7SI65_ALLSI|nr:olfactory receptor 5F1-like [Alligator sinensis]
MMTEGNYSMMTGFILLGFAGSSELHVILFLVFLLIYAITLLGNLGMILLIRIDSRLHTPMYFFLANLAFIDIFYSSCITPKMLSGFLMQRKTISFVGCVSQLHFYGVFAISEGYLLAAMAYDRYVAIRHPLLYTVIMSRKVCVLLVSVSYVAGNVISMVLTVTTFQLSFCDSNIIDHFCCEIPPLLLISCSNTSNVKTVTLAVIAFNTVNVSLTLFISYAYIVVIILKMQSAEGRHKALSTCASHLTAVGIFVGALAFTYLRPSSTHSQEQDKVASMFYGIVVPMLNPLIYSLRNKEVKDALRNVVGRKMIFPHK